ncbi:anti-sigma factor RsiW [Humitalea rosea]|uniref:Anti-sigma factor RsiW n=1 Tax=Humitalea rosea TaxID=990373 RepID=A0A2W7IET5_9PROT|nr:anti-sigma factor [Humitalea rosea]PZW45108.1 anti-sigma factor RsiW [Humitalea rosea]
MGEAMPIGEDDLQAWIDGRLAPSRMQEVEAWMAANPEAAGRYRAMAAELASLRDALRSRHDAPVPARLRIANLQAGRRRARSRQWRQVAAVCAWLALGSGFGWVGHGLWPMPLPGAAPVSGPTRPMVAEAIAAHHVFAADLGRPVEVASRQEDQLLRWLSNRLARPVSAPDLTGQGYRLMGGRLLPGAGGTPAAQLMYQDDAGARLTVYLRADRAAGGETAFRFTDDAAQGIAGFWWVEQGFGYAVLGQGISRPSLLGVAAAVQRQLLTLPSAPAGAPGQSL